jgi:hypothetical protein
VSGVGGAGDPAAAELAAGLLRICCTQAGDLAYSIRQLSASAPISPDEMIAIARDPDRKIRVDAFIHRFSLLQDLIGAKLFHSVLVLDMNEVPPAMVDVLAAMEKRYLIDSEKTWIALRNARNDLAHTYRDDPADAARHLNEALRRAPELLKILERVRAYVMRRGLTDLPPVPTLDSHPSDTHPPA